MTFSPGRLGTALAASGLLCACLALPGAAQAATPAVTYADSDVVLVGGLSMTDVERVAADDTTTTIDLDSYPQSGALDAAGNLFYGAQKQDGRIDIIKVTPAGVESPVATLPASGLHEGNLDLSIAPDGGLVVVNGGTLSRVDPQTGAVQVLDEDFDRTQSSTVGPDDRIYYVTYDEDDDLVIRARTLTPGAAATDIAPLSTVGRFTPDLASDAAGNLYTVVQGYDEEDEVTSTAALRFTRSTDFTPVALGAVSSATTPTAVTVTRAGQVVWIGTDKDTMVFRTSATETAHTDDVTVGHTGDTRWTSTLTSLPTASTTTPSNPTPTTQTPTKPAPNTPSAGQSTAKPSVDITGRKRAGRVLRADLAGIPAGSTLAYQWIVDGKKINGPGKKISARRGHRQVFKLSKRQIGSKVVVKVTVAPPSGPVVKVKDVVRNIRS